MASSLPQNGASPELNGIVKQDAEKGAKTHSFDPNASPAQKGAAAAKTRDQLKPIDRAKDKGGQELSVDFGSGAAPLPPKIVVEDVDENQPTEKQAPSGNVVPGELPSSLSSEIPDWYRVGWRQVSEIDRPPLAEGDEKNRSILEGWIKEQYYGDWYHNAAVIFFAVAASHFLTLFRFGWGWLFLLLISCSAYYSLSMQRVRRRSRDDIQRELVKTRLVNETETADWINNFLDRFWNIYEPVLSATVVSSVDQILSTSTPAFLDSIRLSTFTLGNKAPRINHVRTYPNTPDDIVTMEWALSFTPSDVSDITPAQAKQRVNPKIVLSIRVGKSFAGGTIPILLEDMEFSGEMTIRLKLMTNFPHVQLVDLSFNKPPVFDYVLKPIGGETLGFDIAHIPGLSSFIREQVHKTLGPMMYKPNMFTLNLEQMLSGAPIDTAIGVLQVTISSARSLKGVKIGGGSPDPYVVLSLNQRAILAKTSWRDSTFNPSWNETKFLLINSLSDVLNLSVMDYNDHRPDGDMGTVTFELGQLAQDAIKEGNETPILKDGKERGVLRYDLSFYPVLVPQKEADGSEEPVPDTKTGIVRLTIHQAKDLDYTKSMSGDLNPFARVFLGNSHKPVHTTPQFKHTNNPIWESPKEFLCPDKASSVISVKVVDDRSFLKDPIVGERALRLTDLLEAKKNGLDWFPLDNCKSGKIRISAEWKPLDMAGSLQGADQYIPPIGIVRLWLKKAIGVKNVEAALGGKSDPYVRVLINNIIEGRTEVINNNLNPEWDQIVYIPVHATNEIMLLECMDYQNLTKDRSLGSTELRISDIVQKTDDKKEPYKSTGSKVLEDHLRLNSGDSHCGILHYEAEFVPCLNLKGVSFESQPNELMAAINDTTRSSTSSDSSSSSRDSDSLPAASVPFRMEATDVATKISASSEDHEETGKTISKDTEAEPQVATEETSEEFGIELSNEELLKCQSGVIIFNVLSGHLAKRGRIEIMLDDGYWPACSTPKARSTQANFNYVGEGFIKELDFSRVWIRLNENDENDKEDVVCELKMEASKFLQTALNEPTSFTLVNDDGENASAVEIAAKYVPVEIKLMPRESLTNQGLLRVELLDGAELRAADRGGKSDPYVVFSLNDEKFFKSQTKKKTLAPEWNETCTVQVPSRVGSDFVAEVFDWNQIDKAKSLGVAKIDLASLEPFRGIEQTLHLSDEKHGNTGRIRVVLTFQPEIIAKSRKNTSTFSTAGRAMTQLGSAPFTGAKGVVHGVGSVGAKATGIFRKDHAKNVPSVASVPEVPEAGQISQPVQQNMPPTNFPTHGGNPMSSGANGEPGVLKVTVFTAKDLSISGDIKPYIVLRVGDKENKTRHHSKGPAPEWNETFTFPAGAETSKLTIEVLDHKTFGKDRLLADGSVDIWKHIQPVGNTVADVWVELRDGQGLLQLRLDFDRGSTIARAASSASLDLSRTSTSPSSPSRFLSLKKRNGDDS